MTGLTKRSKGNSATVHCWGHTQDRVVLTTAGANLNQGHNITPRLLKPGMYRNLMILGDTAYYMIKPLRE